MANNLLWKNVAIKDLKDLDKFSIELNRRIKQYFLKLNESGGIAVFTDVILTGLLGDIITSESVKTSIEELDAELYKIQNTAILNISAPTNLSTSDRGTILLNSATAKNVTVPTAVGNEFLTYHFTNIGVGTWTIIPDGSETIHGDANFEIYQDENIILQSDNVGWWVR